MTSSLVFQHLEALHEISPNGFLFNFKRAKTISELFDLVLELGYAANSKELRDTGDEQVHTLLNDITRQLARLEELFIIKIFPSSCQQKHNWEKSALQKESGRFSFRDDGSLELSLIDSSLHDATLHVKRVWSHVSSFGGSWTDFKIKLDPTQLKEYRAKHAELRLITRQYRRFLIV